MASVEEQLESLVLSASEIKELTGWPDAMVEDYLNIIRNLVLLATSADESLVDITDVSALISSNKARVGIAIAQLARFMVDLSDLRHSNSSGFVRGFNLQNGIFARPPEIGSVERNVGNFTELNAAEINASAKIDGGAELELVDGFGIHGVTAPSQPANIPDPLGGGTIDTEARNAIDDILDILENSGQMA